MYVYLKSNHFFFFFYYDNAIFIANEWEWNLSCENNHKCYRNEYEWKFYREFSNGW